MKEERKWNKTAKKEKIILLYYIIIFILKSCQFYYL
jgi:hypothetical protein